MVLYLQYKLAVSHFPTLSFRKCPGIAWRDLIGTPILSSIPRQSFLFLNSRLYLQSGWASNCRLCLRELRNNKQNIHCTQE